MANEITSLDENYYEAATEKYFTNYSQLMISNSLSEDEFEQQPNLENNNNEEPTFPF